MKLHAFLTRLFRAVSVAGLHPANITGPKTTLVTNTHLAAGNHVDGVVGVPMQTRVKVRRKIGLDQERFAGSQDSGRRGGSSMGVVKTLPVELTGPNMRCHIAASSASLAIKDCW